MSVTNDVEPLNYALKSARERGTGRGQPEGKGEPLFIMLLVETL